MTVQTATEIAAALRRKYPTPEAALAALGLDSALLENTEDQETDMARLSAAAKRKFAERLKAKGALAMDADLDDVMDAMSDIETEDADPNAGIPAFLAEHEDDRDDRYETPEERRIDEDSARRVMDARRLLGRDETAEESDTREEEREFKPDADNAARDALRARRAADARRHLGRDESEEERTKREREDEAEDRRRAHNRYRTARDYRRARDAHHRAMDAMRKHAADWKRADDSCKSAEDAHRKAMDAKDADGGKKAAEDRQRADDGKRKVADDIRRAHDALRQSRDARARARDARRAHDEPEEFKGMPKPGEDKVSKAAMDAAIERRVSTALADNDARHHRITTALDTVRPKVGRIAMDEGIKDEGDVFGRALDVLGVSHAGVTETAALKAMFNMAPRIGGERERETKLALDAAPERLTKLRGLLAGGNTAESF